ncbi:hypothetical protein MMC30_003607 [Trapelia coarctata]|nr:hypothetical protein [Trapelia coarctata]
MLPPGIREKVEICLNSHAAELVYNTSVDWPMLEGRLLMSQLSPAEIDQHRSEIIATIAQKQAEINEIFSQKSRQLMEVRLSGIPAPRPSTVPAPSHLASPPNSPTSCSEQVQGLPVEKEQSVEHAARSLLKNPSMYILDGGGKWAPMCYVSKQEDENKVGEHIIKRCALKSAVKDSVIEITCKFEEPRTYSILFKVCPLYCDATLGSKWWVEGEGVDLQASVGQKDDSSGTNAVNAKKRRATQDFEPCEPQFGSKRRRALDPQFRDPQIRSPQPFDPVTAGQFAGQFAATFWKEVAAPSQFGPASMGLSSASAEISLEGKDHSPGCASSFYAGTDT